jgi:16S rRNA (uracil1498-N3)-methyltransferase
MSVPYFFEPNLSTGDKIVALSEQTSKHCVQVLRMQEGDALLLTNGHGEMYEAALSTAHKKQAFATITNHQLTSPNTQNITLGISLLKNATRLEWLFEKATEMGISTIVPLITERTIHERFKTDRMEGIVQSAMLQSQQTWLPNILPPTYFKDFISTCTHSTKLIAHCEPSEKTAIDSISLSDHIVLLIGPEGDFTPSEIDLALTHAFQPVHLGNTRLRTETAALFALCKLKKI